VVMDHFRWIMLIGRMPRHAMCLAAVVLAIGASAARGVAQPDAAQLAVKRLFAPPEDVFAGRVVLPAPAATPTVSRVLALSARFDACVEAPRICVATYRFVHAGGGVRILPLGAGAMEWRTTVECGGSVLELHGSDRISPARVVERVGAQALIGLDEPARSYELGLPEGECVVRVFAPAAHEGRSMALLVEDASTDVAVAHLARRVQRAGDPVELVVRGVAPFGAATSELLGRGAGRALDVVVDEATVRWADGSLEILSVDGAAGVVRSRTSVSGDAYVCVQARVRGEDGRWRARTILYATRVVDGAMIDGDRRSARIARAMSPDDWLDVEIPVEGSAGEVVFAAAELWQVGGSAGRCLGWIGGLAEIDADRRAVLLGVHAHRLAGIDSVRNGSLELRAVRLHARDGWGPLDWTPRMPLQAESGFFVEPEATEVGPRESDWGGTPGIVMVPLPVGVGTQQGFVPSAGAHALILAHGYCADANAWPPSQFSSDAWIYVNANQNMSNDVFATDLAVRGSQFKSYGVVAHSQGGSAALHLHAFYWSGLDWAGPGRLIQAVGTPFEGTALAGNLAALGQIFGVQCGSNYDMTYDGAAAWLSTIPTAARAKVYSHTTTFTNNPFVYDYCNILSDFLLTDPEDGVVEDWSGHIPGANSMGLKTGWCHVSGMRDPDQTLDAQRNASMNAQGAR